MVQTAGTEKRDGGRFSREETRDKDWSSKLKGKTYADDKRGAVSKSVRVSDAVLLKAEKSNKLSSNFHPSPLKVVQKTGSEVTVRNDVGVEFKRNTAFVKKYKVMAVVQLIVKEIDKSQGQQKETTDEMKDTGRKLPEPEVRQNVVCRSTRQVQRPSRFNDFVLSSIKGPLKSINGRLEDGK